MSSTNTILADKDINATNQVVGEQENNPKSMQYHREKFLSTLGEGQTKQAFVSPSDAIQTPGTQKLFDWKEKRLAGKPKIKKPAFTSSKLSNGNSEPKSISGGFFGADISHNSNNDTSMGGQ